MSKHLVTLIYGKIIGKATAEDGKPCTAAFRKAVLVAMADRANDDGSGIYVSKKRIAAEIECDRSTVVRACQTLEAESLLLDVGRKPGNHGYTVIYQISVEKIQDLPDAWAKSRNRNTLDDALGECEEVLSSATHDKIQVSEKGGSSVAASDKNRPYRTIDKNSSNLKKGNGANQQLPNRSYDWLLYEAQRARRSDPERARELEQEAQEILEKERASDGRTSAN